MCFINRKPINPGSCTLHGTWSHCAGRKRRLVVPEGSRRHSTTKDQWGKVLLKVLLHFVVTYSTHERKTISNNSRSEYTGLGAGRWQHFPRDIKIHQQAHSHVHKPTCVNMHICTHPDCEAWVKAVNWWVLIAVVFQSRNSRFEYFDYICITCAPIRLFLLLMHRPMNLGFTRHSKPTTAKTKELLTLKESSNMWQTDRNYLFRCLGLRLTSGNQRSFAINLIES